MNIRPAISVPLPWLTALAGRFLGKPAASGRHSIFRLPRSLSITKEGRWFIGILFFIGTAAVNTGNNLLYLVVATLLSLIIISGVMSESTLRGVRAERSIPRYLFKGTPVAITLRIKNCKARFPSFSFNVSEIPAPGLNATPAYILKLDPGGEIEKISRYTFTRRGRFVLTGLNVSTRFPFGLFLKGREEMTEDAVTVYPSIKPSQRTINEIIAQASGGVTPSGKGSGTQLYGLRDYTLQDDSRYIHWKSAARVTKLLTKEFERERERKVMVVFENFKASDEKTFEDSVDDAAAVAFYFLERGYSVGLRTLKDEVAPRQGQGQLFSLLNTLALITPADAEGAPRVRVIAG